MADNPSHPDETPAGRCGYCACGKYDDEDGRKREDGTAICWCGHTEMEHLEPWEDFTLDAPAPTRDKGA